MQHHIPIKRALLSVSNKADIIFFAKGLIELGIEIISTGGTSAKLKEAHIPHLQVEALTGFPSMLSDRVKTLHPAIFGGILGLRDQHQEEINAHHLKWIDLVVVNFYPFAETVENNRQGAPDWIEQIDIGGPTLARAAAKNFAWVGVVVEPSDYFQILLELRQHNTLSLNTRKTLAAKAFALTSSYDDIIHNYFLKQVSPENSDSAQLSGAFPEKLHLQLQKKFDLRYGENPHQQASAYQFKNALIGVLTAKQHQGKILSYNNLLDADSAWNLVQEFEQAACVIVKHMQPCGVACSTKLEKAYASALACDPQSAFGGIVALNKICDEQTAEAILRTFTEVVIAPGYTSHALAIFKNKPNVRVLELKSSIESQRLKLRFINGGVLMQDSDVKPVCALDLRVVTKRVPHESEIETMLFAWQVIKHVQSNAILIAKDSAMLSFGAAQTSRIDAVKLAIQKAPIDCKDAVLASDAFFPFRDSIDAIACSGVRAIIQPGGSVRDEEVIAACDEIDMSMVFTGTRCFKH